ncbi:hypothetical protein ACGFKZ_30060 [Micromonospora tulbaghiae]|uniref:hypothetical protein n=1 Tax=Micromonospora tulbaghiae TaxID=479978 RepID=UPI0037195989
MATGNLRNVRLNDPIWSATLRLARHEGTHATGRIRDLLDGWIAAAAEGDPEVAALPEVAAYLRIPRPLRLAPDVATDVAAVDVLLAERYGAPLKRTA